MTKLEQFSQARAAYYVAKDEADAIYEAAVKAEYARLRAEDKAAGRDTSGKSVANRRTLAYDIVMMRDESRARRDKVEALWRYYRHVGNSVGTADRAEPNGEAWALEAESYIQPAQTQDEREHWQIVADYYWNLTPAPAKPSHSTDCGYYDNGICDGKDCQRG